MAHELSWRHARLLVEFLAEERAVESHLFRQFGHTIFTVHVVLLHEFHDTLHERLHRLGSLLVVGHRRLAHALCHALAVVDDALDALLQRYRVFALAQGVLDGSHEFLLFLSAQLPHPAIVEGDGRGEQCQEHQGDKPPRLIEIRCHFDLHRDRGVGSLAEGRRIPHLEDIVARGQAGVSHGVLPRLELCPLRLESPHAVTVHTLCLIAVVERREVDDERPVALVQPYGFCITDVLVDMSVACHSILVVDGEVGEVQPVWPVGDKVTRCHRGQSFLTAKPQCAIIPFGRAIPIELLTEQAVLLSQCRESPRFGIEHGESVARGNPQFAVLILHYAFHRVVGQTVVGGICHEEILSVVAGLPFVEPVTVAAHP